MFLPYAETVFQVDLSLESSLLTLKEEILVGSEIIHARLGEHGWNFGNGKDLIAQAREMFYHLNHSGSLARTRTTRQYNLLNLIHISSLIFFVFLLMFFHKHQNSGCKDNNNSSNESYNLCKKGKLLYFYFDFSSF